MSTLQKTRRRKSDHISLPANLVIVFVGFYGVGGLILAGLLYGTGRDGTPALALTGTCVTGLLALLGRTTPPTQEPQEVVGPNGGAVPVEDKGKETPLNDSSMEVKND